MEPSVIDPLVVVQSKWSSLSFAPIHCFSIENFGISLDSFLRENGPTFSTLPPDMYDVRREQIQWLQECLPFIREKELFWKDYFLGKTDPDALLPYYRQLDQEQQQQFDQIAPFRFRGVSQFMIYTKNLEIQRIPINSFTQSLALHEHEKKFDWRKLPRIFSEIEDRYVQLPSFIALLKGIARKILQFDGEIQRFRIVAHHVRVKSRTHRIKGNSPEGIHQDGYPYVVTALVVERENVDGAESQIFDEEMTHPIFTCTLMPGCGILQPDLGTNLWHQVTPIYPIDPLKEAIRSTIGLDIEIEK